MQIQHIRNSEIHVNFKIISYVCFASDSIYIAVPWKVDIQWTTHVNIYSFVVLEMLEMLFSIFV